MPSAIITSETLLAGVFLAVALFVVLIWLYIREAKAKRAPAAPTLDLTEMTILFQTMRSVIRDQKSLAREFNKSVDRKVALVRKVVRHVVDAHREIADTQRRLMQALKQAQSDVARIQQRLGILEDAAAQAAPPPDPAQAAEQRDTEAELLDIVAQPDDAEAGDDLIDNWVGLDFVGEEPDEDGFEVPETVPESPRDPELARQAFRALLSMDEPEAQRGSSSAPSPLVGRDDGGNGRDRTELVRARVYEYHDAGMSVPQIAQELGIGKGEVRLMISLREKQPGQ